MTAQPNDAQAASTPPAERRRGESGGGGCCAGGSLSIVEDSDQILAFRTGPCAMIMQMGLCIFIMAAVSTSLTLFLRHWSPWLAVVCACVGIFGVVCGFFGCANARAFTFCFDRTQNEFCATAGGLKLTRPLRQIALIVVEREIQNGGMLSGGDQPTYAISLFFYDGARCRLEGGVSMSGHGRGPDILHEHAERIRLFLQLSGLHQDMVPVLNITRACKAEVVNEREANLWLSRWLACQGLAPRLSEPLCEYDWAEEPPSGVILPPLAPPPNGQFRVQQVDVRSQGSFGGGGGYGGGGGGGYMTSNQNQMAMQDQFGSPVVVGRVHQPAPRQMQVVVPPGFNPGQQMQVMSPDGAQVVVVVPPGLLPGQAMTIQY